MTAEAPVESDAEAAFIAARHADDHDAMDVQIQRLRSEGKSSSAIADLVLRAERRRPRIPNPLSEREAAVLYGIARGLTTDEIGRQLHLSPSTVKTYVGRVFRKTQARDRTAAVVHAIVNGWIDPLACVPAPLPPPLDPYPVDPDSNGTS